jgi:hypothetical protein
MNLEEQVRLHKEISLKIDQLEEKKRSLSQSIMEAMEGKSLQLGRYLVRRYSRISISTTIDQARAFNAIKTEEVVDKEIIKALHKCGTPIPGIKEVEYIQIAIRDEAAAVSS